MLGLLDDALGANLQRTHELSAEVEVLRADRRASDLRLTDLEARLAAAESVETALRGECADLAARFDAAAESHRRETLLLEGQRVEAREELYRIQTSRLWKTVNLYWRARRAAASVFAPGPPEDQDHPGRAEDGLGRARIPSVEARRRAVADAGGPLRDRPPSRRARARRAAPASSPRRAIASGRSKPSLRTEGAPAQIREISPRVFSVSLRAPDAGDRPRRSTRSIACAATDRSAPRSSWTADPAWTDLARRFAPSAPGRGRSRLGDDRHRRGAFAKISVVVVTWNGRDFNRLCLDSLLARTEWPNLEIVVVDNGSTDGTRGASRGAARAAIPASARSSSREPRDSPPRPTPASPPPRATCSSS